MRFTDPTLGAGARALASISPGAVPQTGRGPVYTVTYFEVAAAAAAHAAGLAGQFAAAGLEHPGNAGFEAFEEIGRPSRFAMFEAWCDHAAASVHAAAAAAFQDELQAALAGPFETRSFGGLSVAGPSGRGGRQAVHVLTHIDVFPAGKEQTVALVKALTEAGRQDDGNRRFDALQWDGHPNHFALVEAWRDREAFDASVMTAHVRDFRRQLTPLEGALYDQRLYHALR